MGQQDPFTLRGPGVEKPQAGLSACQEGRHIGVVTIAAANTPGDRLIDATGSGPPGGGPLRSVGGGGGETSGERSQLRHQVSSHGWPVLVRLVEKGKPFQSIRVADAVVRQTPQLLQQRRRDRRQGHRIGALGRHSITCVPWCGCPSDPALFSGYGRWLRKARGGWRGPGLRLGGPGRLRRNCGKPGPR
jgi:hypothetical protein